ncbi:hypothetical protein AB0M58_13790 [Streptomyces bobili]|uniref:hypothetical protein n=1 Tax=Streptomyces bobili TaxID=67280 RepID=UPI0034204288
MITGTPPPDHRIGHTEHATLRFADGTVTVIADFRIIENAPDAEGRIYRTLHGFTVNRPHGPLSDSPFPDGETRLTRADLRGTPPLVDTDVVCTLRHLTAPEPNTWDHPGYRLSVRWLDRNVNPAWWPTVLEAVRNKDAETAGVLGESDLCVAPVLEQARPALDDEGTLWLGLRAEAAEQFTDAAGEIFLRNALMDCNLLRRSGLHREGNPVARFKLGLVHDPYAVPEPLPAQPALSASADEVLEKIADLKGRFTDGYTPEDINGVFARIEEAGGPSLVCAWERLDENGFGGNSEFYVDVDGGLREISPDIYRWLNGQQDSPGDVDTWACAPVTPEPAFAASDDLHNCARTVA